MTPADRYRLIDTLIHHQRTGPSGCHCGWGALGESHAEHVADQYDEALRAAAGPGGLQARASRLFQLAAGLAADLPDQSHQQRLAWAAQDILEILADHLDGGRA